MHILKLFFRISINWVFIFSLLQSSQGDMRPHVVFIAGEPEYGSHWSLPKIADDLQERFNIKSTVIHSWRGGVDDYDIPGRVIPQYSAIPNLEIINDADLIVLFIRFRIPPPEQFEILQEYFDSGKPAIAFRTTSHAFWHDERKGWFVPFFGGHYKTHLGNAAGTTSMVPAEQLDHPILRGVPKSEYLGYGGVYLTHPLNETATPLMFGKTGDDPAQPLTWINEYKKGQKIFYTGLGSLENFLNEGFLNMVYNTIYWCLDREIPENGVLELEETVDTEWKYGKARSSNPKKISGDAYQKAAIPGPPKTKIPKNAKVLFDGNNLSKWRHWDLSADPKAIGIDTRAASTMGGPVFKDARWSIIDGTAEARPGFGDILTKEEFGNYRLHFDFLIPEEPDYVPDHFKGASGVYLSGRYEIQILDSYGQETSKTSNGAIFNQKAPIVNASKPANVWQSMDIEYRHFEGGNPKITAHLNGKKIHENVEIFSKTSFAFRQRFPHQTEPLFMSSERDAQKKFNMKKSDWGVQVRFQTTSGGWLITNAPINDEWNDNSIGLRLWGRNLVFMAGDNYGASEEQKITANDGEWHNAFLSSKDGVVRTYLDDELIAETKNVGSSDLNGHVLRIGESTKQFWVGASKLPKPLRGQLFDGQIANVQFFDYSLTETDIKRLGSGLKSSKKPVLEWEPKKSTRSKKVVRGPIRLQSDTSKIRFANIWIQPLAGK